MKKNNYFLMLSGILFAIFFINVVRGSMSRSVFLTDVGEMLVLLSSSIAFIIGVLCLEKKER